MNHIGMLSDLGEGQKAIVSAVDYPEESMRRRLQDLGLIKGTEVICIRKSPLGDPVAYQIRGAIIALRVEDSSCIRIMYSEEM
ncbi:ferrous iron transport protein A [Blautia liquoris]|uniref:Ferrous iron transport protein A n=1 Tax=Blautia liquoris TaxID=2779518 RepID=A0A7M2RK48_9FIRM|nr:FeoA family protein [Blautia liquoris]QOV20431.1 ferrous iron transport protein A [Blautia liquoris]